jgi:hypothetical protein
VSHHALCGSLEGTSHLDRTTSIRSSERLCMAKSPRITFVLRAHSFQVEGDVFRKSFKEANINKLCWGVAESTKTKIIQSFSIRHCVEAVLGVLERQLGGDTGLTVIHLVPPVTYLYKLFILIVSPSLLLLRRYVRRSVRQAMIRILQVTTHRICLPLSRSRDETPPL